MRELQAGAPGQVALHLLPEVAVAPHLSASRADGNEPLELLHVRQGFLEREDPVGELPLERHDPHPDRQPGPQLLELEGLGDVVVGARPEGRTTSSVAPREVSMMR